jgi:hypothetical protein
VIGRVIARKGLAHQAGPFVVTIAHTRSYIAFRPIFQFVTDAISNHEIVTRSMPAKSFETATEIRFAALTLD